MLINGNLLGKHMYTTKKMTEPILATSMVIAGGYHLTFRDLLPRNFPGHKIISTTETKKKNIYIPKNSSSYKIRSKTSETYSCLISPQ
jgi:hypothetical protein